MQSPIHFLQQLVNQGSPLDVVERFAAVYSPMLAKNGDWLGVRASDVGVLLKLQGTHGRWICMRQEGDDFFMLGLLMPPDSLRPAARCYYADVTALSLLSILETMPEVEDMPSDADFKQAIDAENFQSRLKIYLEARETPLWRMVKKFVTGRHANTTTCETSYLDTDGKCLVCERVASHIALTTVGQEKVATSLTLTLCDEHVKDGNRQFLVDYLATWTGQKSPVEIDVVTPDAMLNWAESAVVALGCTVVNRKPERCEVTGERPSGFRIVLRCEAVSEKNSYAYMILNPAGTNVRRIDDAHDHPEQPVRWDHRHLRLPKDNKTVEPSFTFGMPLFDLPAIRQEVELAEAK